MGNEKIRVLVVDDHLQASRGTRAMLDEIADIEVVGAAKNGQDAIALNNELNPDILVVDLILPEMNGFDAIRRITAEQPNAKVLVQTSFMATDEVFLANKIGDWGFLLTKIEPDALVNAIRQVHYSEFLQNHNQSLHKGIQQEHSSLDKQITEPLTDRELEVLHLLAKGAANHEIAEKLVISEVTVRTHVSRILGKLNLTNRVQAALYALREGLAVLDDGRGDDPG